MIIDYLEGDYKTLITTLFVVCFTWIVVIVAMLIDLYFGVKKAKELGVPVITEPQVAAPLAGGLAAVGL